MLSFSIARRRGVGLRGSITIWSVYVGGEGRLPFGFVRQHCPAGL